MKKEKWWGTILLLLIIMFSFINKDDITKDTVYVTNTNMTFEIENLTKKINIDDISYEEINSKEKILTINNSEEITYQLIESYLSSDFLKKYPNFIFNNERYQIFTVIYNKDIKLLNNHLDYINELQDLSSYYIFYEPKLDDEIVLLKVSKGVSEIILGTVKI
ncbi:unknown [Clostridium sp. CAG:451]|nr:unknown [Clostridium sp. CAG:451]